MKTDDWPDEGINPLKASQLATLLRNNIPKEEVAQRDFAMGMMCQILLRLERMHETLLRIERRQWKGGQEE